MRLRFEKYVTVRGVEKILNVDAFQLSKVKKAAEERMELCKISDRMVPDTEKMAQ